MTELIFIILVPLVLFLILRRDRAHTGWDEPDLDPNAIVTGVVCYKCGNTLPPHTVRDHFNTKHRIHGCPHNKGA